MPAMLAAWRLAQGQAEMILRERQEGQEVENERSVSMSPACVWDEGEREKKVEGRWEEV